MRAKIELELAKDVGLEANAQNGLEKRNCHEACRPSACEEARLAIQCACGWNRWREAFSIGVALVHCGIDARVIAAKGGLSEGRWLRNRLRSRLSVAVGLVVMSSIAIAMLRAEERPARLQSGSHGVHMFDSNRESRESNRKEDDDRQGRSMVDGRRCCRMKKTRGRVDSVGRSWVRVSDGSSRGRQRGEERLVDK